MTTPVKTLAGWHESQRDLSRYLTPGDVVDEEMAMYFLEVLPPACHTSKLIQIGEPYDFVAGAKTFSTVELTPAGWVYRGHCHLGKNREPD